MRKILFIAIMLWPSLAYAQTSQNGRIMEGALATRPATCSNSDVFIANDSDPPLNFQCGSSNNWLAFAGGGGGGTPGGFNTDVQYNCGGVFCGDSNFTWDFTNKNLTVAGNARFKGPQPWVDVTAFGAVGDGGTDDTASIQAAITYACLTAATVYFPNVPNFYKVIQTQTGASATAPIFSLCNNMHLKGGNARGAIPSFKQGAAVSIVVSQGASPNPGPVFSIIRQTGVTIENLAITGYNEAIYMGDANNNVLGATNNIVLENVSTKANGATGIGTATQPNCAEVYGGGLWYTANGGSAAVSGTFNGNSICILNDTGGQPPGVIQMRDRVLIGCIDAKSIGPQTGTAGDWHFDNLTAEDCNNGYMVIDDDGSHPWSQIYDITIDHSAISDSTFSAYFTLNSNVAVHALHISQPFASAGIPTVSILQGSISWANVHGSPTSSNNPAVDGSGNIAGPLYAENGIGFDVFAATNTSAETDLQTNAFATGGFRAFKTGSPASTSFATVNVDPFLGFGVGLATTYGPEASFRSNAAGSVDVNFAGAYAPTSVAGTPTTGGALANGTYYYFLFSTVASNCSAANLSAPSLAAQVILSGANNASSLTWVDPVPVGTGAIQGYCVFRGNSSQGPHWSLSASYFSQFVTGAGTTSYTDVGFAGCCTSGHVPIGTFAGVHRFTATALGVNTTSPGSYNLNVNGTALHQNYVDFTEIAAPANPSAGFERVWADNSTHLFTCKTSSGGSCISGGGGGGSFQVNGVGLISTTTINFQNSAATTGLTIGFNNPSAGNVQLTLSGTLTIAGGGTGQTTKAAAFDAISPTTTQGDIILNNGTNNVRLAIGTNTQVLTSNGTTASWQTPSTVTGSGATTQCTFWSSSTAITGSANCTYSAASGISLIQGANAADMIYGKRATDSSPAGNFFHFQNAAANSDIATLDVNGNLSIAQKLTTGTGAATHFVAIPEGTTAGAQTGFDVLSADSVTHSLQVSNNNLSFSAVPLFASNTLVAHSVMVTNTTFPLLTQVAPGSAGACFVSNGAGADPSFQGCVGSVNLNNILAALAANTPIANGDFAIKWNWKKTTNSTNAFEISETTASTATSSTLFMVDTLATSTAFPVTFTAGGTSNGVQMSTAGVLGAIGSGGINATLCNSATCVGTATGTANTIAKYTGAAAIANSLLTDDGTTLTYTGAGGLALTTANSFIADTEGTAPSGTAGVDKLWGDSTAHAWKFSVNNGSAQTIPAAQTCTNQVVTVTSAAGGTCTTITSAFVNTSVAVTGADLNTSSQVVSTHITGFTSNTMVRFSAAGNLVNAAMVDNGTLFTVSEPFDMTTKALVSDVTNDGTTGTTTSGLAKFTSTGAINILVSDTSIPVYIIQSGGAVGGTAQFVQAGGQGDCRMDASTSNTEGFFVIASVTIATDCHAQSAQPGAGVFIVGTLISNSTTSGSTSKVAVLNTFSAIGSNTVCSPNAFPNTQTDGATVTWAIASAVCANATLAFTVHSGSRTLNLTGLVNGGSYVIKLIQDATGGENLTGGTGCTWKQRGGSGTAFTLTASPNAIDVLAFTYDGTNCVANIGLNYN